MKKINKYLYITVAISSLSIFNSCKKEFEDTNKNPNVAETPQPDYLLTNATFYSINRFYDTYVNMDGGLLIAQHWAKIQYPAEDAYKFRPQAYQDTWTFFYSLGIKDFTTVADLGQKSGNVNYTAVGKIMSSWLYMVLTDMYGDIPYSEALKVETILTPKYDAQKDVYFGILQELKNASEMIATGSNPINGDLIYNGDMSKWKKFANSLRLRIALRIADREPDAAKAVFADIASKGNVVISSNDDNAQFVFMSFPSNNPINENRKTRSDYRVSATMVNKLKALSDPRISIYCAKTTDNSKGDYVGVPNGLKASDAIAYGLATTSDAGDAFTKFDAPGVIITWAEVLFAQAEAAQRGFASGNAADLYKQAITASMKQYGVKDADIATYLAQGSVAYDAGNYKQSIGEQKWLALFGEGQEAWAEWRRLDYPKLTPGPEASIPQPPYRFRYPAGEQSLNKKSYDAAVAHQGADALTTKLWYDVN